MPEEKSKKTLENKENILGELLFYLREKKAMSVLMLCRRIEDIYIENDIVNIVPEKEMEEEFMQDKCKAELDGFFKQKGLGYKIIVKGEIKTPEMVLREYLGDKLKIKN